jgi:hypothetical protein
VKLIKALFDFYINSSIHVALAVCAMSWITLLEFDISFDITLLWFIFFASITGYNFVKYFGIAKFHHRSLASWLKIIQIFSFACFLLLCFFAFKLSLRTLLCIGAFAIVTFIYAIPFLPQHLFMDEQKNLRSIGGLKVYVIALVWAGVTVLLPLLNNNYHFSADVWFTAFQRFIFVIVLMLPFEIHDLQYDSLKLSTIPQKIGIKNTKICGLLLAVLFYLIEFFKDDLNPNHIGITLAITIVSLLFVMFSKKNQNDYYTSFWVEGIPVLWLFLHLIF